MTSDDILKSARNSILGYSKFMNRNYEAPEHLIKIAQILNKVEKGDPRFSRVIITVPPRHGKSMLCSQFFPAWYIGRNPEKYIITATYGQELSSDFGRKVKEQMQSQNFKTVFPDCELRDDSQSSHRLETTKGGTYFALGVGGPVTGRGAHLLLIDDPIKNREEAESPQIRKKVVEWYTSTAYTRLMTGGAIVVIMARWHSDDFVAWLLKEASHENWVKFDLPALSIENKPLWPEKYSFEALEKIRLNSEYDWQSLYQQSPFDTVTKPFKSEWIKKGFPESQYLFKSIFVDPAISQKKTADETAISVVAFDEYFGKYHEIEKLAGRWSFPEIKQNIISCYERHMPDKLHIETIQAQDWLKQDLILDGIPAEGYMPDADKTRKAMSVQGMFSSGLVHVNDQQTINQLLEFPNGKHDDRMDSLISNLLIMKQLNLKKKDIFDFDAPGIKAITPDQVMKGFGLKQNDIYKKMLG